MATRRWIIVAVLAAGALVTVQLSTRLAAQQKPASTDTTDTTESKTDQATEQELDIRYAEQYLKLIEATLAKYEYTNRKLPNTIRPSVIEAIREGVQQAQERVQLAKSDDRNDSAVYVSGAQAELRVAEQNLRKAEAANLQNSGTVLDVEISRLKADVALAQVRVEKAKHLEKESPLANVRYELEQLREEVLELRLYVALLRDRN